MAPSKPFKTYSRGNNSSISCVEAINILFAKNLTERKLHGKIQKGRNKIQIKELPKKITSQVKSVLSDGSSLHVYVNDTFDKVFKCPPKNNESTKNISVKITANNTSTSVIKHFTKTNHFSPILSKLRSYKSRSKNSESELTDSNSWFKQPTPPEGRITNELEIENVETNHKKVKNQPGSSTKVSRQNSSRESPILLRSRVKLPEIAITDASSIRKDLNEFKIIKEPSKANKKSNSELTFLNSNLSFNPIFTNSVREKILMHSSTPLVTNKSTRFVKQPISPIKSVDDEINNCIFESLEEIKSWEASFPNMIRQKTRPDSVAAIEDVKDFEKGEKVSQSQPDMKKDNFVTVRGRQTNKTLLESERKDTDNSESFNLEDFELFYNKFKTRSFKLEDFEQFHNSVTSNSFNQVDVKNFTQNQVNKLNSVSLKDFESFCAAYHKTVSLREGSFLVESHRTINYVTNRKHRLPLRKKSVNLGQKYIKLSKQFDLKNLVVVLDNILVNNSKTRLKRGKSLNQTVVMKSIIRNQPVINLTRLSINSLSTLKAKDRVSLNNYKACRKFSSNWNPRRSSSHDDLTNSKLSSIGKFKNSNILDLNQLFINITRMPSQIGRSNSKITEIDDDMTVDKNKLKSPEKGIKISRTPDRFKEKLGKCNNSSEKENEKSKTRKSLSRNQGDKKSNQNHTINKKESLSHSHEIRKSKNEEIKKNSELLNDDELYSENEGTSIQMFLHSGSLEKVNNKKSSGEKEYIAKILVGSVRDTELELKDSNNLLLREMNKALRSCSQEDIYRRSSDLFKSSERKGSSRVLRSSSNISLNYFNAPEKVENYLHKPSSEELMHEVNSRISKMYQSDSNITYTAQDLSNSILLSDHDDTVSPPNSDIQDVVVNLTLHSWGKDTETTGNEKVNNSTNVIKNSLKNEELTRCQTRHESSKDYISSFTVDVTPKRFPKKNHQLHLPKSAKKSLRFELQSKGKSPNCSDLIDSSLNMPNENTFKVPMALNKIKQKVLNIKAGKSWRRSLLVHRRESIIDLTRDSQNSPLCSIDCRNSLVPQNKSVRRQSVKIVPLCDARLSRRRTVLQTYAQTNLSTLLDNSDADILNVTSPKTKLEKSLPLITAKDIVLKRCGQTEPLPFGKLYPKSLLKDCKKIGEGVYGEVFMYSDPNDNTTVMKVIPIEGDKIINGERQKKFDEILSEIVIASELSKLRKNASNQTSSFSEVRRICCVKGKYPKTLLDLWDAYDITKGSENDHPGVFADDQLYIVLDLANGGRDLEAFVFNSAQQAVSMFKQVACALAVAEQHLQFEHRDLHWGNVLLKSVDKNRKVICKHRGNVIECQTQGVEVTVIDFTLSRIAHDGVVIFNDLGQDPDLFVAQGDYQFDIYRMMKEKNSNNWQKFEPYTNILWLHYILKKSITALRYKNSKTKLHKKNIDCLKEYESVILNFTSVSEFVNEYY